MLNRIDYIALQNKIFLPIGRILEVNCIPSMQDWNLNYNSYLMASIVLYYVTNNDIHRLYYRYVLTRRWKKASCEHERFLSGHNSSNVATFKVNFRDFETAVSIITLRLWFPLSADTFQGVVFSGAVIFNSW